MTRRADIVDVLRRRIVAGLRAGTLLPGDRLPSTRDVGARLDADPRVVLAAYRELAGEQLVELRERSGIYVAARDAGGPVGQPAAAWLVDVLASGVAREVPAPDLAEWLRRAVETVRLRAAVVARTTDQLEGIAGELRALYGIEAAGVEAERVGAGSRLPAELRRADLLVTTEALEARLRPVAAELGRPLVVATVRPDLVGDEWRRLLAGPVHVVVADPRFADLVAAWLDAAVRPGHPDARLRVLVAGRDDLSAIPPDGAVYVTRSARDRLGGVPLPGVAVPSARIFSPDCTRTILELMVRENLRAAAVRHTPP
jgi:DNA-binding transcriptional regulator YhcF (GntR family)